MSGALVMPAREFLPMCRTTFGHVTDDHFLATVKRFTVVIVGNNGVYVRPPSKNDDAPAYRFTDENLHKDLLTNPGHKTFFGKWKNGDHVTYEGFDEAVQVEQDLMDVIFAETKDLTDEDSLVKWWVAKITAAHQPLLAAPTNSPAPVIAGGQVDSPSPARSQRGATHIQADPDGQYRFHPGHPTAPVGSSKRPVFRWPDTSVSSSQRADSHLVGVKLENAAGDREAITDEKLAQIVAKVEKLSAETKAQAIAIEESPPKSKRPRVAMAKSGACVRSTMDEDADIDFADFDKALEEAFDSMCAAGAAAEAAQEDDAERGSVEL